MYVFVRVPAFHRGVTAASSSNHSVYTDVFVRRVKAQHCKLMVCTNAPRFFKGPTHQLLVSIVVSIPACHAGDRGSIPRRGERTAFFKVNNVAEPTNRNICLEIKLYDTISGLFSVFQGIGCSVVEFSPATREARVRFPANAGCFEHVIS
jgi:hypothetical protein